MSWNQVVTWSDQKKISRKYQKNSKQWNNHVKTRVTKSLLAGNLVLTTELKTWIGHREER